MPRRPVRHCQSVRILCPDPTCARVQRSRQWQGYVIDSCEHCGVEYFAWSLFGAAAVTGLWPGEAATIDVTRPLPEILSKLGLLDAA